MHSTLRATSHFRSNSSTVAAVAWRRSAINNAVSRDVDIGIRYRRHLQLHRPVLQFLPAGQGQLRLYSSSGDKPPPKGFEKFYRKSEECSKAKQEEKIETEAKEDGQKPPSETQQGKSQDGKASSSEAKGDTKTSSKDAKDSGSSQSSNSSGSSSSGSGGTGQQVPPITQQGATTGMLAALLLAYMYYGGEEPQEEITIQDMLKEFLVKGYIEKIQIVNKSYCRVILRADAPATLANGKVLTIQLGRPEAFEAKLEQVQAELGMASYDYLPIQYINETELWPLLMAYLPSLLILIPMIFMARAFQSGMGSGGSMGGSKGGRNMFSMGKAFPNGNKDAKSKTKFTDVAGLGQAKREVTEFVDFLKNPAKYEKLGARTPKGGLLVGPPGTGKTLLAKAVAGEADVPFYSMSGSDFVEMFVGVGPSRVRDLFKQARDSAPSIIFIDEIDAVGRKRGSGGAGGNDERENTLNQMLVEMDGFSSGTGVVVLAGTNRVDVLDNALTRPGRFDRQIAVDKPDLSEREEIYMVHLKPVKIADTLSKESVAKRMSALTPGFAGSDIANVCNEAAIFAARRQSNDVQMQDFERATERVLAGLPKTNNLMGEDQRRAVAIHESGHAVMGWYLEHSDPLLKVTIVPRSSGALGFAQYLPQEMSLHSKEAILDKIAVSLAGRAAEELYVGAISTGASDDLDKVTKMAYAMVSVYGMSDEIGLLSYSQNSASEQFYKPYCEQTSQAIDAECRKIVDEQYERVKQMLTEKKQVMMNMSNALMEKETLVYTELRDILGERPFGLDASYEKYVTASGNPFDQAEAEAESKTQADSTESPQAAKAEATPAASAI